MKPALFLLTVAPLFACAGVSVSVTDSGAVRSLSARAEDCQVEFFRTKRPIPAYEEIATLHLRGSAWLSPELAQEELRRRACRMGADAVVVTQELYEVPQVGSRVTATLVSYRSGGIGELVGPTSPVGPLGQSL